MLIQEAAKREVDFTRLLPFRVLAVSAAHRTRNSQSDKKINDTLCSEQDRSREVRTGWDKSGYVSTDQDRSRQVGVGWNRSEQIRTG